MDKKYIWEIENNFEYTCYDYNSGKMVYCAVTPSDTLEDDSIYKITDNYFLYGECVFFIYETKEYTKFKDLKKLSPNWIFKGKAEELWEEFYERWKKNS